MEARSLFEVGHVPSHDAGLGLDGQLQDKVVVGVFEYRAPEVKNPVMFTLGADVVDDMVNLGMAQCQLPALDDNFDRRPTSCVRHVIS
jgi:hypothetical protein